MKTILIVDDDPDVQELLSTALNQYTKHKAISAEDGEVALDLLRVNVPDLILLDMMMPRIGGIALFTNLQNFEHTKNIPVIFISGEMVDKVLQKEGLEMGAAAYFTKPLDIENLLNKINELLGEE